MSKPTPKPQKPSVHHPEKKIGPYASGIGVAIWSNTIDTEHGPRQIRSITVSPRRYRDPQTGDWKDAPSYRPADLPALIFALQKALEYVYTTPLPGQEDEQGQGPY
jgi:hypothetical protein